MSRSGADEEDDALVLPPRPERPSSDDCCKSDCMPCIFELYEEELERWERQVAAIRARHAQRHAGEAD